MNNGDSKYIPFRQELYRKLTHLGALVIPGGYYLLGLTRRETLYIMIPVTIIMIIIDIARLRNWKLWSLLRPIMSPIIRRHEMKGDFTGAFYILIAATLTIAFFPKIIAITALVFIILGDTAAALIGRKFGRHKFRNKSYEGSLAFFLASAGASLMIPGLPLIIGLIGAFVATVTEALSYKIDDNISVPLLSGLCMFLLTTESIYPYLQ